MIYELRLSTGCNLNYALQRTTNLKNAKVKKIKVNNGV